VHEEINLVGTLNVDRALYNAHELFFPGGAAAGYKTKNSGFGLGITTLWGITNGGAFSYARNNVFCNDLEDEVKNGDFLRANVFIDASSFSDKYSYFDTDVATVQLGGTLTLYAFYIGYDANYNPVSLPLENSQIYINGEATNIFTDNNGKATIEITRSDTLVVTAQSSDLVLFPPLCVVNPGNPGDPGNGTQLKGNACFEVVCEGSNCGLEKMKNATEWESRTNGCIEYRCDNESGFVFWSICNSTDKAGRFCLEGVCMENDDESTKKGKVFVEIVLTEGVRVEEINATQLAEMIGLLCNVSSDKLTIGYEIDANGYVLRVYVYVGDESTANVISTVINDMNKEVNCQYGILCRAKQVVVNNGLEIASLSGSERRETNSILTLFLFVLVAFQLMMN